ncbi:AraC family transcriptional regulator, partial [Klebsiella pneumoniae]
MIEDLPDILHRLIGQKDHLQVRFPEPAIPVPALAFNVP